VSPPAERRAAGPPGGAGLASAPSLGPDGAESRPHRGHASEIVFGAPLVPPGQILDTEEPPPADFITKLRQSNPPLPSRPLSYVQMAAKPAAALLSAAFVYIQKGGTVLPLVAALQRPLQGPRLGPEGVPAAGGRAGRVGLH
jgi:hypothetical protein